MKILIINVEEEFLKKILIKLKENKHDVTTYQILDDVSGAEIDISDLTALLGGIALGPMAGVTISFFKNFLCLPACKLLWIFGSRSFIWIQVFRMFYNSFLLIYGLSFHSLHSVFQKQKFLCLIKFNLPIFL